jgi:HPt (histidine-containing phosphotransfer) domain-containing protein
MVNPFFTEGVNATLASFDEGYGVSNVGIPLSKPIDLEHLARYTGGERALNAEILKLFDTQVTDMVGQLNSVLAVRDAKRWREITHTIKGAARGVGAFGMGEAAAAAEPVDPANADKAKAAIKSLENEAQSVRGFIQDYLAA